VTRLALVMIARDEAGAIARALASARAFVDRMIVLDTGSVDATREIAAAAGAEVHAFAWRNDFAAARNAALAHSDAEWNLILDADEWIEEGAEALGELPSGGGFLGEVRVASRMDQAGVAGTGQAWLPRLLPRGVRYAAASTSSRSAICPACTCRSRSATTATPPRTSPRRRAQRNAANARARGRAEDPYLWFQLAKEHQARGRAPQAALCFREALRLADPRRPYRHALVVRTMIALRPRRAGTRPSPWPTRGRNWPESPDFYFTVGDLYLEAAVQDPARAATSCRSPSRPGSGAWRSASGPSSTVLWRAGAVIWRRTISRSSTRPWARPSSRTATGR
jgi:hypothetical protein